MAANRFQRPSFGELALASSWYDAADALSPPTKFSFRTATDFDEETGPVDQASLRLPRDLFLSGKRSLFPGRTSATVTQTNLTV